MAGFPRPGEGGPARRYYASQILATHPAKLQACNSPGCQDPTHKVGLLFPDQPALEERAELIEGAISAVPEPEAVAGVTSASAEEDRGAAGEALHQAVFGRPG